MALDEIALFFDIDGTLLEIMEEPGAVHVPEDLPALLLQAQDAVEGALALVSGRPIAQMDALFKDTGLSASGLHGLEHRRAPGDTVQGLVSKRALVDARRRIRAFAAEHPGVIAEDKGLTLALHYRKAPQHYEAAAALMQALVDARPDDLVLLTGKMVFELKPPGFDKGRAIAAFMEEAPFRGRSPVFAGDDVTDEAGFSTVNAMNGCSIRIGSDCRPTEARFALADVTALRAWLQDLCAGGESRS
jgi:trehalose 6-phosphate phosphatase